MGARGASGATAGARAGRRRGAGGGGGGGACDGGARAVGADQTEAVEQGLSAGPSRGAVGADGEERLAAGDGLDLGGHRDAGGALHGGFLAAAALAHLAALDLAREGLVLAVRGGGRVAARALAPAARVVRHKGEAGEVVLRGALALGGAVGGGAPHDALGGHLAAGAPQPRLARELVQVAALATVPLRVALLLLGLGLLRLVLLLRRLRALAHRLAPREGLLHLLLLALHPLLELLLVPARA